MTVRSYAKINLGLLLLRKRPDGFHDLETVFHRIDFFDEIDFVTTEGHLRLVTDHDDLPPTSDNLCIKAAELMRRRASAGSGVTMTLRKRIPIGAGLGGGSSNAAAVLLALKDLWSVSISEGEMVELALSLGSDVPYFLREGSAIATGRGDCLEVIPLTLPYWIVVIVPPFSVSTTWAYQNVRLRKHGYGLSLKDLFTKSPGDYRRLLGQLTNDFEPLVLGSHPAIQEAKQRLMELGGTSAIMSGSGSAVFAFFDNEIS
ncbi:MAG: 4-(cytidine 5'-diphospho)-2-C-methyl-D-erythritol kinase, partial [Proteobacteria bacterium]|nr:4-(cytidine 5'-diphospho)-2-C-methyl-D-erythritol kinase [Pseudomonadota bacterium]